jgi:integrase
MAKLHRRKDRGNRWELDYTDIDGKRYRIPTGTADEKTAQLWQKKADELLSQARLGIIEKIGRLDADIIAGKTKIRQSPTLDEFKAIYEDRARNDLELSENSIVVNNAAVKSFIGVVGDKRIGEITEAEVRKWKRQLDADGKSKTTLSMYHRHLRAMFNRAQRKWKMIDSNPFEGVEVAKGVKKKEKNMSYEEVKTLLKIIRESGEEKFELYVLFELYTACRRNEILFLRFEDINLKDMTLRIYQQKTSKTILLPINKALKNVINKMEMKKTGFVFQTQSRSRGARDKEQPWHQDFVTHKFKKLIRKAGLNDIYTLHSLRHTYATMLREKGVPLDIVQKLLGHSSYRTTDENYDHSSAIAFRSQADLVNFEEEVEEGEEGEKG